MIFIENPTWLAEAYTEPINRTDTGYVWRNLWARDNVRQCIDFHLNPDGMFLDYAAGYGMFVRLMRDLGYNFQWYDLYCKNLFSQGFEAPNPLTGSYEAVTAFEVFEHLVNANVEMEKITEITSCLIFSTEILPQPAPRSADWMYYAPEHGQHVTFYTSQSLELLGRRFGYNFISDGVRLHAFTRKQRGPDFFQEPNIPRWFFWAKRKVRTNRQSLMITDHDMLAKQLLQQK
jgi:hypothetical protein